MYKSVKRATIILLCVLIGASMIACNTQGSQSSSTTKAPSSTTTAPSSTESQATDPTEVKDPFGKYAPEITINIVRSLDSSVVFDSTDPNTKSLEENLWAEAYKDYLGITFNYLWTPTPEQYDTKWNTAIASSDIPDIGVVNGVIYQTLVEGNLVEDCTEAFNDYASDIYKSCFLEVTGDSGVALNMMTFDGKLLGIPVPGICPESVAHLWIRKDWLDAVGMTEPKTIDDLIKTAQAFVDAELGGTNTIGIALSKEVGNMRGFMDGCNAYYNMWIENDSGELVFGTIQPEMEEALLLLQQMYRDGLIREDFAVLDYNTAGQDCGAGKCGIQYGGNINSITTLKASIVEDLSSEWKPIQIPTLDGSPAKPSSSATPSSFVFVRAGYEYPEAAVKLTNLNFKLILEQPVPYSNSAEDGGLNTNKYIFPGNTALPWQNLIMHEAILDAITSGDTSDLNAIQLLTYGRVVKGMADRTDSPEPNTTRLLIFGENGSYAHVKEYRDSGRIVLSAYQSFPTKTMLTLGDTLEENLNAAILKVIMGDNITTFQKAAQEWKRGGGDTITQEVNEWFTQSKNG